ncbi:hypothetical protein [Amycolatopsis pretoriensis]|uniref:hypothetical protein n=1 Tax=Amycolatopsis pretoriensis TaxID=218821 RepID=UPI0020113958|nr:hypothetical protein [Amycolatopsis pretoriensis]
MLLRWASVPDVLRPRLCTVLADIHNLLGWIEFDAGHPFAARLRFERALEFAVEADNDNLVANIHYRLGRLHLHHDDPGRALDQFGRGDLAARRSGAHRAHALLQVNTAWAHAMTGDEATTLDALARAEDLFGAMDSWHPPQPWEAFFGSTDMAAMRGSVFTELAHRQNIRYSERAIPPLAWAIGRYGPEMARSRSLTMIMLAHNHALRDEFGPAAATTAHAIAIARHLGSVRPKDRLGPLAGTLRRRPGSRPARELLNSVTAFRVESLPK